MSLHHAKQERDIIIVKRFNLDHVVVDKLRKRLVGVIHICDAPAHTCRKVSAGGTKHHHTAAGHVLTSMIADALDDCGGT